MPKKYITKKNRKGLKIKNKSKSRSRKIQKRMMRKSREKQRGGMQTLGFGIVKSDYGVNSFIINRIEDLKCGALKNFRETLPTVDKYEKTKCDDPKTEFCKIKYIDQIPFSKIENTEKKKNYEKNISNYHLKNRIPEESIFVQDYKGKFRYLPKQMKLELDTTKTDEDNDSFQSFYA